VADRGILVTTVLSSIGDSWWHLELSLNQVPGKCGQARIVIDGFEIEFQRSWVAV
jgi:hypothetical protein